MEAKWIILLISILQVAANAIPYGGGRDDAHVPTLIKNIYDQMNVVMEQDDQDISLKYLKVVKTVRWLAPVTLVSCDDILDSHHYTLTFNTSGLQEQPTSVQLHLQSVTSVNHLTVINITINQEVFVWRELADDKNETEVRISLEPPLIWTTNTLTIKVTSTVPIKMDHNFGLLLYMGGVPEGIDDLLSKPLDKKKMINDQKERLKRDKEKRDVSITGPCQRKTLTVTFSQLGGIYQNIIAPKTVEIGQCVGECYNQTLHAQVLNLLASKDLDFEESSSTLITPLPTGCTVLSFKPEVGVLLDPTSGSVIFAVFDNLIVKSCGCSTCSL